MQKVQGGHWGALSAVVGLLESVPAVPAQFAQRAALLAVKLPNKHLFLISRSHLLERAPKRLLVEFPVTLKQKHLGLPWSLFCL